MGIKCKDLREYVIRPTLDCLGKWSDSAENLLLGTAAQESYMGYYLHQLGGPALGIYQMEVETHDDIWDNYLKYRGSLRTNTCLIYRLDSTEIITNLKYATAMARIHYLRISEKLPDSEDVVGLAKYWKKYYNTKEGRGTEEEFIKNYDRYVK